LIIKQISAAKSKVLKYLDEIEERLITEVESVQEKHEEKINKEKHDIIFLSVFWMIVICFRKVKNS
jgi:ABC-type enterochelin transport system substrate-binding protein